VTEPLTFREREVANLIVEGLRSAEIAERLSLGIRTIESYRTKVKRKLGARNTADVVRMMLTER
jgi:DNA-binding CsgD family transcriptional regulator